MINTRAAGDARHARTGKDGAFYNADGVMLASVESFTSNVNFNNASYAVLLMFQKLNGVENFSDTPREMKAS